MLLFAYGQWIPEPLGVTPSPSQHVSSSQEDFDCPVLLFPLYRQSQSVQGGSQTVEGGILTRKVISPLPNFFFYKLKEHLIWKLGYYMEVLEHKR